MEAAGCMPSIGTWNTLLGLLVNPSEGGIDVGVKILTIMRRADVPINQATFAALANVRKAIEKGVRALVSFPVVSIYARSSTCSDTNSESILRKRGDVCMLWHEAAFLVLMNCWQRFSSLRHEFHHGLQEHKRPQENRGNQPTVVSDASPFSLSRDLKPTRLIGCKLRS